MWLPNLLFTECFLTTSEGLSITMQSVLNTADQATGLCFEVVGSLQCKTYYALNLIGKKMCSDSVPSLRESSANRGGFQQHLLWSLLATGETSLWIDWNWGWTSGNPSCFTLAVSHVIWMAHLCYTDLQLVSVMKVFFSLTFRLLSRGKFCH